MLADMLEMDQSGMRVKECEINKETTEKSRKAIRVTHIGATMTENYVISIQILELFSKNIQ